jgi:tRNA dimethylallyltransferase
MLCILLYYRAMKDESLICLMGATATGKTAAALYLADCFPVEIISVDSALLYRGMDIGTAKPSAEILAKIPHHLVDILEPEAHYSVGEFLRAIQTLCVAIRARGARPLLVGGTMMYFHALQHGIAELPAGDSAVRAALIDRLAQEGLPALYEKLKQCDPLTASRVAAQDTQRILRALEVYQVSGQALSVWQQKQVKQSSPYTFLNLVMDVPDRALLHQRIAARFEKMLSDGFIDEVATLKKRPDLSLSCPSMRSVGYRQAWQYLDGVYNKHQMIERSIVATRQLAKRQLTWLRNKWPSAVRIDATAADIQAQLAAKLSPVL